MELEATGEDWAIATPHALATEAGAVAFERGGNAVDAALAAAVTLAVVYPHMCGVGGDLFALIQRDDAEVVAINASGRAPAGIDPEAIRARHGAVMPERGPDTVTVPGAVSGWAALHDAGGRLPWTDAFTAAVAYAHGGVSVSRSLAASLEADRPTVLADPGLAGIFAPNGRVLDRATAVRQPELGTTLQSIAANGPGALYGGSIGTRFAAGLHDADVPISLEDLRQHRVDVVKPLVGRYRDLDVRVVPPNSQGLSLLQILSVIEGLAIDPDPEGPDAGLLALTYLMIGRDRDRHLADPGSMRVRPSALLDEDHVAGLCEEVRGGLSTTTARTGSSGSGDTVALVAADASGWAVSLIESLYDGFGSGILEPTTGIIAQSRGACFTLEPEHPNIAGPQKRPAHTLMPVMVHRDGRLAAVSGSMGGHAQPQINATSLIRAFDLEREPADVLSAPRWLVSGMDRERDGRPFVAVESRVTSETMRRLDAAGFEVNRLGSIDESVGHAQLIITGSQDGLRAATDPRADGGALAS
jgi:gamma-glutamyltranspeptidase